MRLAIATDAWAPQVNGVVRTLTETISRLKAQGHEVEVVAPDRFMTIPCPGYSEIRLALAPRFGVRKALGTFRPDIVHISTEGPIGWSARAWCLKHNVPFTTAFHTRFPEYVAARTRLSPDFIWPIMRTFHKGSRAILTATQSLRDELKVGVFIRRKFGRVALIMRCSIQTSRFTKAYSILRSQYCYRSAG